MLDEQWEIPEKRHVWHNYEKESSCLAKIVIGNTHVFSYAGETVVVYYHTINGVPWIIDIREMDGERRHITYLDTLITNEIKEELALFEALNN